MITILDKTFVPFIDQQTLEKRISDLASQMSADYKDRCPLFIVVLNGAFLFATELLKRIPVNCEITFVKLASYENMDSTGQVRQIIGLEESIKDRDVVVIEDIVDTGLTMSYLIERISAFNPASVEIATLLHKPDALKTPVAMRYIGFEIANRFVVGYGLDYNGLGRNLDALYVIA